MLGKINARYVMVTGFRRLIAIVLLVPSMMEALIARPVTINAENALLIPIIVQLILIIYL